MFVRQEQLKSELNILRVIHVVMVLSPMFYLMITLYLGDQLRTDGNAGPPVLLRTILYIASIITFPLINLIRHIMIRLNQTMPGDATAIQRYTGTILISLSLAETIAFYGPLLYILGDDINNLYIFTLLAVLAMILYRPKQDEYSTIVNALRQNRNS